MAVKVLCLSYWTTREFPRHFKRNKIVKSCSALFNFIFWLPFNFNDQHLNKKRICSSIEVFASLMVQLVKNPPAMQETWVWSLGQEDSLDLPTPIFWLGEFQGVYIHGIAKSWTWLSNFQFHFSVCHITLH